MKRLHNTTLHIILSGIISLILMSCDHKELYSPDEVAYDVMVNIEWDSVPDTSGPQSGGMILYFYPKGGGNILRFELPSPNEGKISLLPGIYDVLAYNSDLTNIVIDGVVDKDSTRCILYKKVNMDSVSAYLAPGMLYSAYEKRIVIEPSCCCCSKDNIQTVTLFPKEVCDHYLCTVENVDSLENVRCMYGVLSDMNRGRFLASYKDYAEPADIWFQFTIDKMEANAKFLTFGNIKGAHTVNTLYIYAVLKDDRRIVYDVNVTRQITEAPDPRNVHIRVSGLKIPSVNPADTVGQGGIKVGVDGWKIIDINIP